MPDRPDLPELISRLRARADLLDKALDFMGDEELREEARVDIADDREAADALEILLAEARKVETLRAALDSLRAAWNAHMAACPQHEALPVPTFEQIAEWRNAPSGTASAVLEGASDE